MNRISLQGLEHKTGIRLALDKRKTKMKILKNLKKQRVKTNKVSTNYYQNKTINNKLKKWLN